MPATPCHRRRCRGTRTASRCWPCRRAGRSRTAAGCRRRTCTARRCSPAAAGRRSSRVVLLGVDEAVADGPRVSPPAAPAGEGRDDRQGAVVDERGAEQAELVGVALRQPGSGVEGRVGVGGGLQERDGRATRGGGAAVRVAVRGDRAAGGQAAGGGARRAGGDGGGRSGQDQERSPAERRESGAVGLCGRGVRHRGDPSQGGRAAAALRPGTTVGTHRAERKIWTYRTTTSAPRTGDTCPFSCRLSLTRIANIGRPDRVLRQPRGATDLPRSGVHGVVGGTGGHVRGDSDVQGQHQCDCGHPLLGVWQSQRPPRAASGEQEGPVGRAGPPGGPQREVPDRRDEQDPHEPVLESDLDELVVRVGRRQHRHGTGVDEFRRRPSAGERISGERAERPPPDVQPFGRGRGEAEDEHSHRRDDEHEGRNPDPPLPPSHQVARRDHRRGPGGRSCCPSRRRPPAAGRAARSPRARHGEAGRGRSATRSPGGLPRARWRSRGPHPRGCRSPAVPW